MTEGTPAPGPGALRGAIRRALLLAGVLGLVVLGELSPAMRALERVIAAHETPLLAATIGLAALGFVLLMGGALHMVLTAGPPMTPREAEDQASFREVKAAWRDGAWRRSPRWRRLFLMGAGGLLMFVGIFGIFFVTGPVGVKLVVLAVWLYAAVQTVRGFRRA